mmetsp:Transcript_27151/g.63533  ORF Transcript_27151/g.63533 Transcript_27151/m.63533 type:complete len:214 (+) Transcript_27151:138-779(+)
MFCTRIEDIDSTSRNMPFPSIFSNKHNVSAFSTNFHHSQGERAKWYLLSFLGCSHCNVTIISFVDDHYPSSIKIRIENILYRCVWHVERYKNFRGVGLANERSALHISSQCHFPSQGPIRIDGKNATLYIIFPFNARRHERHFPCFNVIRHCPILRNWNVGDSIDGELGAVIGLVQADSRATVHVSAFDGRRLKRDNVCHTAESRLILPPTLC